MLFSERALVVEPSPDLRELIRAVLVAQHFVVDAVADAEEVVPGDAGNYALVVADVPFGEMTTLFAERLHARFPRIGSHVVLMSADRDDSPEPPSRSELLLKPFDRRSLVRAVNHATGTVC